MTPTSVMTDRFLYAIKFTTTLFIVSRIIAFTITNDD